MFKRKAGRFGIRERLEYIYSEYNKREYVYPDPLVFLYEYPDVRDREIAGLVSACLAYGRVGQIMKTVSVVLEKMGKSPFEYIANTDAETIVIDFKGFQYRFAKGFHLSSLLIGIKRVVSRFVSLENCFVEAWTPGDENVLPGLLHLTEMINLRGEVGHLLADPAKKSPCKRSNLFLRWMVRQDRVDPGGWKKILPSQLIVPLDTHMHKIGIMLELTRRRSPDIKTAIEITEGFRKILSEDPVKYDFCLTRFGIRGDLSMDDLRRFFPGCLRVENG